ncbi:MAG: general secretion pathway protein GspK, partial [Gammaproteobacteria bacterium]|nr:general secretion pathway protein GspK [Gammaproteobacteria bacterium]
RRLLTLLPLDVPLDPGTAAALTEATIDWLDWDQTPLIEGAEDDRYTGRQPPYRPANFWFVSPSELLAVEGYTGEIYRALEPHVTALPPKVAGGRRGINVNAATDLVLASLLDQSPERVEALVGQEFESPEAFQSEVREFLGADALANVGPDAIAVRSSWFLLTVTASIGSVQSTMYSLLERNGENVRTRLRSYETR